jgi:hypothetical protein
MVGSRDRPPIYRFRQSDDVGVLMGRNGGGSKTIAE